MFKLLTIAILSYILYRLVKPPALNEPQQEQQDDDEGEFIDYEELDD